MALNAQLSKRCRILWKNPVSGVMIISLVKSDTLGDFANSIEAAAMGFTNPVNRENARELLIREGYKVVPVTADCRICEHFLLCYDGSNHSYFLCWRNWCQLCSLVQCMLILCTRKCLGKSYLHTRTLLVFGYWCTIGCTSMFAFLSRWVIRRSR